MSDAREAGRSWNGVRQLPEIPRFPCARCRTEVINPVWIVSDDGHKTLCQGCYAACRSVPRELDAETACFAQGPVGMREQRPLRRVVREFQNEHGVECEELECGHVVHRKSDIIGPTNAYRRRCRKCVASRAVPDPAHTPKG